MLVTDIFHKLVFSARLFMKKASCGCCVIVFDSSGEPAVHPENSDFCVPVCSGTEFEVRSTTSCEECVGGTAVNAPMDYESSMNWFIFLIRQNLGRFSSLLSCRSSKSPCSWFWGSRHFHGGWNEETEEIAKLQNFSSFSASSAKCISFNRLFGSRPQSNVVGAGFRRWYVSTEMRILLEVLHGGSSFLLFLF